ncbi:hypothetical protein RMATCC62417_00538 [Rhizopus microsporus]|nr:hypothetical protein RMATCC62417_00538 [Rhizopus microsporus]
MYGTNHSRQYETEHNVIDKSTARKSDPSIISAVSSNLSSLRLSEMSSSGASATPDWMTSNHHVEFDIIDSLDYDDVDDGLIDQEMMHQKRESIIKELHNSEKMYIKNVLEVLRDSYILPLRKSAKQPSYGFLGMKKPPCTERETNWLFCNFEDIIRIHQEILTSLEERLAIWGPTQIMSDVVLTWFPKIQEAYHVYFDNYSIMVTTVERLNRYPPFKKFSESIEKSLTKERALLHLLTTPVSCIPRYGKLLSALADSTYSLHPDYAGLMQCKQRVEQLFEEFKMRIAEAKNIDQVYEIHTTMTDQPFGIRAERRLYLQGDFIQITKSNTQEERAYFLFSDMLVYVRRKQNSLQYKGHIQLERAKIRLLPKDEVNEEGYCIEIISSFQGVDSLNTTFMASPTVHIMKLPSKAEQMKWKACLENSVSRIEQLTMQSRLQTSNSSKLTPPGSIRKQGTTISNESSKSVSLS